VLFAGGKTVKEAHAYTETESRLSVCNGDNVDEQMKKVLARCQALFFGSAYRFLHNAADAEDAVQDALLSAYKHIDQFRGEAQMSTWLTTIVSNSARMQLRKRSRQIHVSLDEPIGEEQEHTVSELLADCRPTPEDECRNSQLHARVKEVARQLSPALRKAFELRDLDGLSISEAAHILGVSVRRNSKSPVVTGAHEAQAIDAARARQATSCISDLRDAEHVREIKLNQEERQIVNCLASRNAACQENFHVDRSGCVGSSVYVHCFGSVDSYLKSGRNTTDADGHLSQYQHSRNRRRLVEHGPEPGRDERQTHERL
jgi:RNA polymerase sigma factor (sigma-70 family)